LNLDNKPYNVNRIKLVFLDSVDFSASDSRYLELDADVDTESLNNKLDGLELEK
jgi:hypothetical protein